MGGILGQKPARPHDEVDPIDERRGEIQDQFLQGSIAQTSIGVELVVRDMAKIGLGLLHHRHVQKDAGLAQLVIGAESTDARSEEHTSELQSLMRISYADFCLKKKKRIIMKTKH